MSWTKPAGLSSSTVYCIRLFTIPPTMDSFRKPWPKTTIRSTFWCGAIDHHSLANDWRHDDDRRRQERSQDYRYRYGRSGIQLLPRGCGDADTSDGDVEALLSGLQTVGRQSGRSR